MGEKRTFTIDSPEVQYLCKTDKRLAKAIPMLGDLTYELHDDPYTFLVSEIIEQMLSVKAGRKIYKRLKELCGGNVTPENVNNLSVEEIRTIGTSKSKANYIKSLTDAVVLGSFDFEELEELSDKDAMKKIMELKGIGEWTAHMYLIFVLDRKDILPTGDVAFLQTYEWLYKTSDRTKSSVEKKCKKWHPGL